MNKPKVTQDRSLDASLRSRGLVGVISGLPLGLTLLVILFVYLAAFSVLPGNAPTWPYTIWPLKAILGLLILNMTLSTLLRLPLRAARLGAWLAHAGTLLLACGSVWFMAHPAHGLVANQRPSAEMAFEPTDKLYLDYTTALYAQVTQDGQGELRGVPLAPQPELQQSTFDKNGGVTSVSGVVPKLPTGVSVEARQFVQAAMTDYQWQDDGPVESPGVGVTIIDAQAQPLQEVLAPAYIFARVMQGNGYTVRYEPAGVSPEMLAAATSAGAEVIFLTGKAEAPGQVIVIHADGKKDEVPLAVSKDIELTVAGRKLVLSVGQFYSRAWRKTAIHPVPLEKARPAAEVEIGIGEWHQRQWVSYDTILHKTDPADPDLAALPLGGGRWLFLQVSQEYRKLPHPIQITRAQYETYPGSGIPKDYICDINVLGDSGGVLSSMQCRLNKPVRLGEYRLYQGTWLGDPNRPLTIVLLGGGESGIWAVWTGMGLICIGIPYGFYVKPILLRRGRRSTP